MIYLKAKNYKLKATQQGGFIALTATLILSAVLLMIMFTGSTAGFFARFDALGSEFKRVSLGLSESCSNAAILKVAQDYDYEVDEDPDYVPGKGVPVEVGPDTCYIQSIETVDEPSAKCDGPDVPSKHKCLEIVTSAQYPEVNGSWSTHKIKTLVQNPATTVTAPPPTCAITASPSSVPSGQPITVQWASSPNATSFDLSSTYEDITISNPAEAQSGSRTYTATGSGAITFSGVAYNIFGVPSPECTGSVTVTAPPPAPSCADSVMMLDRTGSMSAGDLDDEEDAANGLLDLYSSLSPAPKTSVGVFAAPGAGEPYLAKILQTLTNNYPSLYNAVASGLAFAAGGTHLGSAIGVSNTELNSARHTPGLAKVLILVSDGEPNRPGTGTGVTQQGIDAALNAADTAKLDDVDIFTIHFGNPGTGGVNKTLLAQLASGDVPFPAGDTGYRSPTINQHTGSDSGVAWTNPPGAHGNGGTAATVLNSSNSQQRYYNFNIPAISASASINDVQIKADAWLSLTGTNIFPTETFGNVNSETFPAVWSEPGIPATNNTDIAGVGSSSSPPEDRTLDGNVANKFARIGDGEWICRTVNAAGLNTLTLSFYWKGDADAESSDNGYAEYKTGGTCADASPWTSVASYALGGSAPSWSSKQNINLPASLNNSTFLLRFRSKSNPAQPNEHFRVDDVSVSGFSGTPATNCKLGVDLSWNAGVNWSTEQTWDLPLSEQTQSFSGWGSHTWAPSDFTNTNFRARVRAIDPGAVCDNAAVTNLDWLQVRILYGVTHEPGSANDQASASAENNDGDNFFIAPAASDMENIFETIGAKVCPALAPACSNTVDDDGDGLIDEDDPSCHAGDVMTGAYNPNENDEWTAPDPTSAPTAPALPPPIDIDSWDEVINILP